MYKVEYGTCNKYGYISECPSVRLIIFYQRRNMTERYVVLISFVGCVLIEDGCWL